MRNLRGLIKIAAGLDPTENFATYDATPTSIPAYRSFYDTDTPSDNEAREAVENVDMGDVAKLYAAGAAVPGAIAAGVTAPAWGPTVLNAASKLKPALHPAKTINTGIGKLITTAFPNLAGNSARVATAAKTLGTSSALGRTADILLGLTQENDGDSPSTVGTKRLARKALTYGQMMNPGFALVTSGANSALGSFFSPILKDRAKRAVNKDTVTRGIKYIEEVDPEAARTAAAVLSVSGVAPAINAMASGVDPNKSGGKLGIKDIYPVLSKYFPERFPDINFENIYSSFDKQIENAKGHAYNYLSTVEDPVARNIGRFALKHPQYIERLIKRLHSGDYAKPLIGQTPFFIDPLVNGASEGIEDTAIDYAKERLGNLTPEEIEKLEKMLIAVTAAGKSLPVVLQTQDMINNRSRELDNEKR